MNLNLSNEEWSVSHKEAMADVDAMEQTVGDDVFGAELPPNTAELILDVASGAV